MKSKIKNIKLMLITLAAGLILGWVFFHSPVTENKHDHQEQSVSKEKIYTCSMHPQIKQNKPGLCPICGMELVPVNTSVSTEEHMHPDEIQMSESALALASVQTTRVTRDIPQKNIFLQGKVKADERNIYMLTARFGGRIEKLNVNFTGQEVTKGQPLGTIYSPDLINAQKELLEAVKSKAANPSLYNAAKTKLKLWELSDEQISAIEETGEAKTYLEILSPATGTVLKRHAAVGDYVKEGTSLFDIIDLSKVWVLFDVYENDLPWIKSNDKIDFTVPSLPGRNFSGRVTFIDPFIDAQTRVAQIRIEMNNPNRQLKPEMFVNGELKSGKAEKTSEILIPKSSILWTGKRSVVYVKVPDRETASFRYREVVLGTDAGNFYVVKDGLSEGDEIAVNGVFKIDAAAQLAGKASMMNPEGGPVTKQHNHGETKMENMKSMETMETTSMPEHDHEMQPSGDEHVMFKVAGNCGMCKTRIENAALALKGVLTANWEEESNMLHLSLNPEQVKIQDIHKAIASAGHDTKLEKADDEVYNNLPECCKYSRE